MKIGTQHQRVYRYLNRQMGKLFVMKEENISMEDVWLIDQETGRKDR